MSLVELLSTNRVKVPHEMPLHCCVTTACVFVKVLDELRAIDLWGRSVLTHALLSGHEHMFEAVLTAVRDDIPDEEVCDTK